MADIPVKFTARAREQLEASTITADQLGRTITEGKCKAGPGPMLTYTLKLKRGAAIAVVVELDSTDSTYYILHIQQTKGYPRVK